MIWKFIPLLIIFLFLICVTTIKTSYATVNDTRVPFEIGFFEHGYTHVEDAIKEFETFIGQNIDRPYRVPPIPFSHCFGRFNKGDDNVNLEVRCLHEDYGKNHFKLHVRPIDYKIQINDKNVNSIYMLRNGIEAKYINISESFEALVFEKDHLQYMFSIDKRVSKEVTPEVLVEMANSM